MPNTFFNKLNRPLGYAGRPIVEFRLFGQWEKTLKVIQQLGPAIKKASMSAQLKVLNEIKKKVKAHLRNQDLGWVPLSDAYKERKAEAGFNGRILLATKTYYESIDVWTKGNQHFGFIGVRRGIYTYGVDGKKSRLDVATIAAIHEFSSGRRVPRRPLWNPTIAEMGGAPGLKELYTLHFKRALRAKGIPIKSVGKLF